MVNKILSTIKDFFLDLWEKITHKETVSPKGKKKRQFSPLAIVLGVVLGVFDDFTLALGSFNDVKECYRIRIYGNGE